MREGKNKSDNMEGNGHQPYRIHLPGFITEEDIGFGEVIKHATHAFGIKPCGGCERRAAALDRWFVFTPPAK